MEQMTEESSVRDSRRRAAVALAIVEEHTGPMKKIIALTRKHPWPSLAISILAGLLLGRILRGR